MWLQDCLYTVEKDSKARASHQDVFGDGCSFVDVESFVQPKILEQMKKVGASKSGLKRFDTWLEMASKSPLPNKAYCAKHLCMFWA